TYNQVQVFSGSLSGVAIYTGDSSAKGASIDNLYFAVLSSSSIGDAGGTLQQNSNASFVDLSVDTAGSLTKAAATTDTVAGGLTFTTTNVNGSTTTYTTTSTTLDALITEINAKKIPGVTASFTTAGAVGASGVAAGDTGIQLTNNNPNVAIGAGSLADSTSSATTALKANTAATTTISYKFAAGGDLSVNLGTTDLLNAQDAASALSAI